MTYVVSSYIKANSTNSGYILYIPHMPATIYVDTIVWLKNNNIELEKVEKIQEWVISIDECLQHDFLYINLTPEQLTNFHLKVLWMNQ